MSDELRTVAALGFCLTTHRSLRTTRHRASERDMRRRVVITGMGVLTPLGHTVSDLFASQVEGRTAVGPITRFDARTFPTTFASEVKGFELGKYIRNPDRYDDCGPN